MKKKVILILTVLCFAAVFCVGCGSEKNTDGAKQKEAAEQATAALPLEGVIICADAGHGQTANGGEEPIAPDTSETRKKHSTGTAGQTMSEEALNLAVALRVQEQLTAAGAEVIMTRTSHECDLTNIDRANLATEAGADLTVRIHADGSENTSLHGISVLIPAATHITDEALLTKSAAFGDLLLAETVAATGAENRGIVERDDLTGFNWSKVPVALIEMGFMSNPEEDALLSTEEYQQKLAEGIVRAVKLYFAASE